MVDRELFESYQGALGASADMAKACVESLMADYAGALTRDELERVYRNLVATIGAYAAQAALEFYRAQRELSEADGEYEPRAYTPDDSRLLSYDVRNSTNAQLPGIAAQRVLAYADETIYRNGDADPGRVAYAVVPHPGACGWCLMIGANAWFYSSKRSAESQRHPNCKCSVVADFDADAPSLSGYDPERLRRGYAEARDAVFDSAEREWASMTREERAGYDRPRRSAHDVFLAKRIAAELSSNRGAYV